MKNPPRGPKPLPLAPEGFGAGVCQSGSSRLAPLSTVAYASRAYPALQNATKAQNTRETRMLQC